MKKGDIVRLKGTDLVYRIRDIYETYTDNEWLEHHREKWCVLVSGTKEQSKISYWKLNQLELVKEFAA